MSSNPNSVEAVDARVAQLQHALDSRVVIEQAKGVIAERYALTPFEAFDLMRLAARGQGMKMHALSESVVASRQTPDAILTILERNVRNSPSPARAVENIFREVNRSLLKLDRPVAWAQFICECADPSCTEPIALDSETMRRLHADNDLYVVKRGHSNADLEETIDDQDELVVVRKPAA
jgi:hypothetical protein